MGPWELLTAFIVVPLVAIMIWFQRRFFDADGVRVPAFEAWCARERPLLFALHCAPDRVRAVAHETAVAIGGGAKVMNHHGTHPWTLYVFTIEVAHDVEKGVVLVRAIDCAMHRGAHAPPDLGRLLEALLASACADVHEAWLHGELHESPRDVSAKHRKYGWIARDLGSSEIEYAPMIGRPTWL